MVKEGNKYQSPNRTQLITINQLIKLRNKPDVVTSQGLQFRKHLLLTGQVYPLSMFSI